MADQVPNVVFVSDRQLLADLADWETRLPYFDAFVGVPRSGVWPAVWLAMRRNVQHCSVQQLIRGEVPKGVKSVLVLDDHLTGRTGGTQERVAAMLAGVKLDVAYGSVYWARDRHPAIKHCGFQLPDRGLAAPWGPIFEYDWHRRYYSQHAGVDMDGVLCTDWVSNEHLDPEKYQRFLTDAAPVCFRNRGEVVLGAVVTGRLEKYRTETLKWLIKHKIKCLALLMFQGTLQDRNSRGGWRHKVEYLSRPETWFFVESCPRQSRLIAEETGKPVFCSRTREVWNGRGSET